MSLIPNEPSVWTKCPQCQQDWYRLRESGLCIECDPWKQNVKDKKKTSSQEITDIWDDKVMEIGQ